MEETQDLQDKYIDQALNNSSFDEEEKKEAISRKNEVTLCSKAIDELKAFVNAIRILIVKFYYKFVSRDQFEALDEDLRKLALDVIMRDNIYKIMVALMRV